jgi:transcriptional regulator with XRE-family HTH domain
MNMDTPAVHRVYNAEGLGRALRQLREEAGLTQAELAEVAGIPRLYIVKLENGEVTEQVVRLVALLKLLGSRIVITKADW